MKLTEILLSCVLCFTFVQLVNGQGKHNLKYTKGDNNISVISNGSRSSKCSVVEYSDYLVLIDIPYISTQRNDSTIWVKAKDEFNPLVSFIDSIYLGKPIKYILNTHSHGHSLSNVLSFLERGATVVTAKENMVAYDKKGLFGEDGSTSYGESIIQISSDTTLLAGTENPIEVIHLKKSDYKSIPTETFLFFNFTNQKLLAASCMVYLQEANEKYGLKGLVYSDRLVDANQIMADKNLDVEYTLQLHKYRIENDIEKPAVFPISHFRNVLKHSWSRQGLSEHFKNMSYAELTTNKASVLDFLVENEIYHSITNNAVYELIANKEYAKAVALAELQLVYRPDVSNLVDTLGEAYYNNGQIYMAENYDKIIKTMEPDEEGLGMDVWKANQKERFEKDIN